MLLPFELSLFLLVILLCLSAVFAASETAIFSVSHAKAKRLSDLKKPNADLLFRIRKNPQNTLTTILILNNLVNISAASLSTALVLQFFPSEYGVAVATGIITILVLIFGEITPKSVSLRHNVRIALSTVNFLNFFTRILYPLIWVMNKISGFFVKVSGGGVDSGKLTEGEIKTMVSMGAAEGAIDRKEKEMIHKIFLLDDILVSQVMTPKEKILAFKSGTKLSKISIDKLREHSRMPVYGVDLNDIRGVFYVRDFIGYAGKNKAQLTVDQLMRRPMYVNGEETIDDLLNEFQKRKIQMALVTDTYGETLGLITIEDILEEIVGDIDEKKVLFEEKTLKEGSFLKQV